MSVKKAIGTRLPAICAYLACLFAASSIAGCDTPRVRPAAVPEEAVWAGGVDGGQYYLCDRKDTNDDIIVCSIYNDYTGALEARGEIILNEWEAAKYTEIETFYADISAWDGVKIYLVSRDAKPLVAEAPD